MTLIQSAPSSRTKTARTVGDRFRSVTMMLIVTLAISGGIGSRLAYLQLVEGTRNLQLAENNRIRVIPKQPQRGNIFDRKGKVLAGSRLSHAVYSMATCPEADGMASRPQAAV